MAVAERIGGVERLVRSPRRSRFVRLTEDGEHRLPVGARVGLAAEHEGHRSVAGPAAILGEHG